ncbi:MAG: hypothetical protein ACOZEN_09450 [Thermodesulfobacteriota bacterium]
MSIKSRLNRLSIAASGRLHVVVVPDSSITQDEALGKYIELGGVVHEGDTVVFVIDSFGPMEAQ